MGKPSKQLLAFMEEHEIDADEVWEVRAGGAWAIKHSALERVATQKKITFDRPAVLESNAENKISVICVFGTMGEVTEWSIGEAAPYNNKNSYPFAMAEKRAKDRVTLKLLNAHGVLYSESEADEFVATEATNEIKPLPKKDSRETYSRLQSEIDACMSSEQLREWGKGNRAVKLTLPVDWQRDITERFNDKLDTLKTQEAA